MCNTPGHQIGDETCKARNTDQDIIPFKSHQNVLSNFYMCDIKMFGQSFPSAEHAYQWKKAIDTGNKRLAEDILLAEHAGKAKRLSKDITADLSIQWEQNSLPVMQSIVDAKAEQVPEFRQKLLETEGCHLAEATRDKYWASGLSIEDTEKINPKFYPGENRLGHLLMETRDILFSISDEMTEDDQQSDKDIKSSVFPSELEQVIDGPSDSAESKTHSSKTTETQKITKQSSASAEPDLQKQTSHVHSKSRVMTNIKGILSQQREKSKRKPSKTPEKEKGSKIQKHQKGK